MDLLNLGLHLFFNSSQTENGVRIATIAMHFESDTVHRLKYLNRREVALPADKRGPAWGYWTRLVAFDELLSDAAQKHGDIPLTICWSDKITVDNCNRFRMAGRIHETTHMNLWHRIQKNVHPSYEFIRRAISKDKTTPLDNFCHLMTMSKDYASVNDENHIAIYENDDKHFHIAANLSFQRDERVQSKIPSHLF